MCTSCGSVHTGRVATTWQEYQEEAAAFYRSLGLEAETDVTVKGARGEHDIDVVVRLSRAGLDQTWVVECKHWKRPVDKSRVALLAQIVSDVGADRGVILTEAGFQSGASRMANNSNVTLTSLAELRERTASELLELRLGQYRRRLALLSERFAKIGQVRRHGPGHMSHSYPKTPPGRLDPLKLSATVAIVEDGLQRAEIGRWPAPYARDFANDRTRHARDLAAFIDGLANTLDELEVELEDLEARDRDEKDRAQRDAS